MKRALRRGRDLYDAVRSKGWTSEGSPMCLGGSFFWQRKGVYLETSLGRQGWISTQCRSRGSIVRGLPQTCSVPGPVELDIILPTSCRVRGGRVLARYVPGYAEWKLCPLGRHFPLGAQQWWLAGAWRSCTGERFPSFFGGDIQHNSGMMGFARGRACGGPI